MSKTLVMTTLSKLSKNTLLGLFLCFPILVSSESIDLNIEKEANPEEIAKNSPIELSYISYKELYTKIANIESKHKYDVANKSKMVGKYQASRVALLEFGYSEEQIQSIYDSFDTTYTSQGYARYHFDIETFPPEDQEKFIRWFMHRMETVYLKETIHKYVGTTINGVYITRAGILNASMMGFNHVIRFLESNGAINYTPRKGYSIQERLELFEHIEVHS